VTVDSRAPLGVHDELQQALARQTRTGRVLAALAIPAVVAVLVGELAPTALIAWAGIMALEGLADFVWSRPRTSAVAAGAVDTQWLRHAIPYYCSFGLAWGSLPMFALIDRRPNGLWLATIISLAIVSVYVVTTAASRLLFAIGATPILGQLGAAIVVDDATPARLGLLTLAFAGIVVIVHDALHRSLVDSVRSRHVAEQLAVELGEFVTDRDPATQLRNRRSFITTLDAVIATRPPAGVTVEIGNVRRLTAMNELFGEQFGDALLGEIGRRLGALEAAGHVAARLAGDEFVIASVGTPDESPFRTISAETFTWDGRTATVDFATASAQQRSALTGAEELLADAMFALRSGRKTGTMVSHGRSADSATARRELVDELRRGLRQAGVRPWFQPIVDAASRQVIAWEALVRWEHPVIGMVPPDRLLPLLDMAALNGDLLEVLVEDSTSFLRRLDAAGAPPQAVHVNINAGDLRDRSMPDTILGAVHDAAIAPERVVLELTEREILHVDQLERTALARLDAAGIHLAVDDFGTGYSSLPHLLDFPADHVKIDRRFVAGLPDDADAYALARGVISMAHGLGLTTVAEGVETEAAALAVLALGCDQLQGYLMAPALPPDQAIAWWQQRTIATNQPAA
jgi:predicted signal transduction protein with EAL and GGDEF domain